MRIVNKKLLAEYAKKPCCVCGSQAKGHHVKTKGSGGDDVDSNLIPLCTKHHTYMGTGIHPLGVTWFMQKYFGSIDHESWGKLEKYLEWRGL